MLNRAQFLIDVIKTFILNFGIFDYPTIDWSKCCETYIDCSSRRKQYIAVSLRYMIYFICFVFFYISCYARSYLRQLTKIRNNDLKYIACTSKNFYRLALLPTIVPSGFFTVFYHLPVLYTWAPFWMQRA